MVYVLNMNGKPLMPTERHGKVRRMLRDGKAHVVRLEPFTIQLDYSAEENIQDVSLGIENTVALRVFGLNVISINESPLNELEALILPSSLSTPINRIVNGSDIFFVE